MKIARLVRALKLSVVAADPCVSACFLIFAGGVERLGGEVGVHRPFFIPEEYAELSAANADRLYSAMTREVEAYLAEMQVPQQIVSEMMATPSTALRRLTPWDTRGLFWEIPSWGEWVSAKCRHLRGATEAARTICKDRAKYEGRKEAFSSYFGNRY